MSKQSDLVSVSQGASGDPLFIDTANDRVGVGTSSPATKLDVVGPASVTSFTGTSRLGFTIRGSTGATDYSGIDFIGNSGVSNPVARIAALTTGGGSFLSFGTSNVYASGITNTAMTIDYSGNLLVGTTTAPSSGSGGSAFIAESDSRRTLYMSSGTTASTPLVYFFNPNGLVGYIVTSGSATAYNTSSDYRLKENVVPLAGAADRLAQIPVHRFNFIADPDRTVDGFLAHEVQEFVPEAITGTKDEVDDEGNPVYQGIDQSKLVPLLTAALQEALSEIQDLKARVATLEGGAS